MNMCEAPGLDGGRLSPLPGGFGGGAFGVLLSRARAANTHPITVPMNNKIWEPNSTRVVELTPMNFGHFLCPRKKGGFPTSVIELSSESVWGVSGCGGTALTVGEGTLVSAGCRAGKGARSTVWEGSWVCSWTPSTKPISPRLDGIGPACGLVRVVEEDATAAVDAITGREGGGGRSGKGVNNGKWGLRRQLAPGKDLEGRQHQVKGRRNKWSGGNNHELLLLLAVHTPGVRVCDLHQHV